MSLVVLKEVVTLRYNGGYIIKFDIFVGDYIRYCWFYEFYEKKNRMS